MTACSGERFLTKRVMGPGLPLSPISDTLL
jgi:hypothetical protein